MNIMRIITAATGITAKVVSLPVASFVCHFAVIFAAVQTVLVVHYFSLIIRVHCSLAAIE